MKFFLDENFPRSVVDIIVAAGHEVIAFTDLCEFGDDDESVFAAAQSMGAVILTSDRDFYHTMPLLHPDHAGIVVIALRQPNRASIRLRLQWFLDNFKESIANKVFILRDHSCCMK